VLDATTGQNGLVQARQFTDAVGVTGVVLTKLDGTAKGGVVLAVRSELGIPIKLVGVGVPHPRRRDPADCRPPTQRRCAPSHSTVASHERAAGSGMPNCGASRFSKAWPASGSRRIVTSSRPENAVAILSTCSIGM
jgi:hypothetical protein